MWFNMGIKRIMDLNTNGETPIQLHCLDHRLWLKPSTHALLNLMTEFNEACNGMKL